MGSSQIQGSQPESTSISINTVEISIENLIKRWKRRQNWKLFFDSNEQVHKRSPWRTHLAKFLESTPVRVVAIFLLLIDLFLTILELSSSLVSCSPNTKNNIGKEWYHWLGIAILGLLCLKTMALAVGLGRSFFRRPGYVLDGVILMSALLLEAFLEKKGGGLLVVVSLWRVVRVVESVFELSDEAIEAQIGVIVCQFEALKEENRRLLETIVEKDKIIEKLQEELDQCRHHI